MKKLSPNTLKIIIGTAVVAIAVVAAVLILRGTPELIQLNSSSMTDWRLGASIEGISSREDGASAQIPQFSWFEEPDGDCGLESSSGTAWYYMGNYAGSYCVTGFASTAREYSLLGIRVGDDELGAKTELLDRGYSMTGGGFDTCTAVRGNITVELGFRSGAVTQIAAYLN